MAPLYLMPARVNQHVAIVRTDPGRADPHLRSRYDQQRLQNKQQLLALAQGGATREALTKGWLRTFLSCSHPVLCSINMESGQVLCMLKEKRYSTKPKISAEPATCCSRDCFLARYHLQPTDNYES